ncbi:hypothetical protein [Bartonella sp. DGB2]|uniref:hypothetical protein n=1 Tax=Bartonella sp. DGB2 TaxID=3388426 RepID=UPI00399006D5
MPFHKHRYAKLLKVQNLLKMRDEAELNFLYVRYHAIQEQKQKIISLLENDETVPLYNTCFMAECLQQNEKNSVLLANKIFEQQQEAAQSTYRYMMIEDSYKATIRKEEQQELARMLEDFITQSLNQSSSLA